MTEMPEKLKEWVEINKTNCGPYPAAFYNGYDAATQALWQKLAPVIEAAKCFNKMSGFEISYDPPAKKENTFFDIQDRFNNALSEAGLLEDETNE